MDISLLRTFFCPGWGQPIHFLLIQLARQPLMRTTEVFLAQWTDSH